VENRQWTVIEHSGQTMTVEHKFQRFYIKRPKDEFARQIFDSTRPEQTIDDATLQSAFNINLPRPKEK